jgi:hypothetical protein
MPEINFDIAAARKAGATDNDIANYFKDNYKIDFDIVGARKAGANDNDILSYLNQQYGDLSQKKNEISSSPSLGTQSQLPLQKPKSLVPSVEPFLGNTLQESVAKNKEPKSELDNITASFKKGQLQGKIANALPIGRVPNADELSKVAEYEKELQSIPASENEQAFATEGFKIFKDPLKGAKFLTETITSSLSSLFESGKRTVPAAVGIGAVAGAPFAGIGAAVGAGTGLTAGLTTAGINLSTSGKILELLQSEGVDVSDKDSLVKAFSDENKMSVLRSKALKYGLPIALFDVVSGSIGGKLIAGAAGKSIAKKSLASLGEAAIQSSLGSGGELAGQIASGQKVDWNEVALEGVSSLATDLPDVAVGAMIERKKASSNNKTIAKQVGVLGKEVGTEDALHNLNRDLANKVITPQEYEEGVSFVEKAVKIDDTIPETIKGDNRATSIELIDERQKLEEEIIAREEQKKTIDVAFHKPLDEANKELSKRIDEINEELGEISKKRELPTEVPVEETQVPIVEGTKEEISQPIELSTEITETTKQPNIFETPPALSDVESTAKALEEFQEYQQNELYNLTPSIYFGKDGKYGLESVAEAYHADKATGKETELTKAVEELLGKPKEEVKPTETEPIKLTEEQKQKAKETVDEIKKINLTHVEGTGMGSEQADGMYISTEKGGNRYATKDRPAKQVEVEIENPKVTTYEENKSLQKETTSELIEKEALGLEDVETQYWDGIKKHSGKGLSDITPKDVTSWFNSIKDKFKKETYEEYLKESGKLKVAKSITEQLKSEGYDALYIPESKNIEGELIVFDRSKVKEKGKEPSKVEPVKKSVTGIKPPKVEGDKITTISGKTEQERLDSIEKRKKETTVTEKVKAENDLWQDAQSLFSKNKNYLKSSEGLQELNRLRNKARALGFEVDLSRSAIVKKGKNGRLVKLKYNNKADSGAAVNENGIVILDRPKEVQDTFNEFNELGVFLDAKRPDGVRLTPEQIEGAIQDIIDGIPSNRANDYLDLLEKAIDENAYPIYDKGIGEANVRIEELRDALVGKENIGSPMDEESLISFLNEEANLTPEQEEQLLDNIDNLLTEYETEPATELPAETRPETEVSAVESKTEEGVSTKAEPITETTKREPTEIEMAYEKAKADRGIRNANMKQFVTENKDSIIAQLKLENKIKQECK